MARTIAHMVPRPFFVTPLLVRELDVYDAFPVRERQFRDLFGNGGVSLTVPNIVKAQENGLGVWCLLRWALLGEPRHQDNSILKSAYLQDRTAYAKYRVVLNERGRPDGKRCDRAWTSYRQAEARILLSALRKAARRYKKLGYKAALKLPGIGKAQLAFLGVKP